MSDTVGGNYGLFDTTEWTSGENGYKESYCCRVAKAKSGLTNYRYFIFRTRHIGKNDNVFQKEWVRDTDTNGKGVKFTICVGYAKIRDLMYSVMREVEYDQYGLLRKVSKAKYAIYRPTMI